MAILNIQCRAARCAVVPFSAIGMDGKHYLFLLQIGLKLPCSFCKRHFGQGPYLLQKCYSIGCELGDDNIAEPGVETHKPQKHRHLNQNVFIDNMAHDSEPDSEPDEPDDDDIEPAVGSGHEQNSMTCVLS